MCTVSFIPRRHGYAMAMNRDENLTRPEGLPPRIQTLGGRRFLSPSDPGGGTWIAVNEAGVSFALVNWYAAPRRVVAGRKSRGLVVLRAATLSTIDSVDGMLEACELPRTDPFRLVGFFPETREIVEWRWNLQTLDRQTAAWEPSQWISSGFDEPAAQIARSRAFNEARRQASAGRIEWLRRYHRGHSPGPGPFSVCMHREDAATVSYTEISLSDRHATMRSLPGPPCQKAGGPFLRLLLNRGWRGTTRKGATIGLGGRTAPPR